MSFLTRSAAASHDPQSFVCVWPLVPMRPNWTVTCGPLWLISQNLLEVPPTNSKRRDMADSGEDFFGKALDHTALEGVGQVHDEVLDPGLGVLVHQLGDPVRVAMQRMPRADERLVLAGSARGVRNDAVDLVAVAQDAVELERLQDRVVVAADVCAVLAQHLELVPDGLDVRVEVARVSVLGNELERHPLPRATDPDRRMRLLHRLRLVDRAADLVVAAIEI